MDIELKKQEEVFLETANDREKAENFLSFLYSCTDHGDFKIALTELNKLLVKNDNSNGAVNPCSFPKDIESRRM